MVKDLKCVRNMAILFSFCANGPWGCVGTVAPADEDPSLTPPAASAVPAATTPARPSPDTGPWRLTRTEYNNTIRDLLGDTSQPANALPPDRIFGALDNNAATLTTDLKAADIYERIAGDAVERAFRATNASRAKVLAPGNCKLDTGGTACARAIVSAFARRAWRGQVADDEIDRLMAGVDAAAAQGDSLEEGVKLALRMALVSPYFLYRVELDPPNATGLHAVSPQQLATRLSYFLWSSTPDPALLARADDGTLVHPDVFAGEMTRLLADPRADALVDNFASQWLGVRDLGDKTAPDTKIFRSFDEELRQAMMGETRAFFRAFLDGDRDAAGLLATDFTFVNQRLARHYQLGGVTGTEMRQVPLAAGRHRFGLLSQAGFLTVTSNPNRTSPVKRGKWVLTRLLCSPPAEPPADVPPLAKDPKEAGLPANATVRQMMSAHSKEPRCVSCHAVMDPIGFALEHYDGIGSWRDAYPNNAIDARGELSQSDGTRASFDGAEELSRRLGADPRFLRCFARTLFAYALGRDPTADGDRAAIDDLTAGFAQRGGRIRALIGLLATSQAFRFRGGQP